MDEAAWLPVKLYLPMQVLTGSVYHPFEERILDLLNDVSTWRIESPARFLLLSEVTIHHADGTEESLATTYISKANIQLVTPLNGDSGRGIGAKVGHKTYPFVQKSTVPVKLQVAGYTVTGTMHCASGERVWDVVEARPTFLPLTEVEIHALADNSRSKTRFAAVNREQILSLQEEGTPLL